MKHQAFRLSSICALILTCVAVARAGDAELTKVHDVDSAFDALLTLDGDWEGTVTTKSIGSDEPATERPTTINYRVSGNYSMLIATYLAGTTNEMLTIYHKDGPDTLMLTHYCSLRNQPQMKLELTDEKGFLKFAFDGGMNFDPAKDAHAHEGTIRFIDADTIETTSVGYNQGKPATHRKSLLKRVKN